jgi:OOP family OmpA-OmpF porin
MKLFISAGTLGLAILAALAMPLAHADEHADDWGAGGYIGGNFGRTTSSINDQRIVNTLLAPGFTATSIGNDDRDTGFKIFGGYAFNRNIAIEAGYFNLGRFSYNATTLPAGTFGGSSKFSGVNLDLVGTVPLGEHFSVFGRIGATYGETRNSFFETGAVNVLRPNSHNRGGNYKFGAGLEYDFNHSFGVRAEAERYRVDDAIGDRGHVDLLSLGLVYRFGGELVEVEHPAPVAYTPPPQPAVDCSTMDDDHDGVNNCNDRCPSSPAGQVVGAEGCPVPAPEPVAPPPKPFRG